MKKVIFICTSNKDRSPALEKYFSAVYPQHEYRSAGINKYFTSQKYYLKQEDLDWADLVVFAEDMHYLVTMKNFSLSKHIKFGEKIGKSHIPPMIFSYTILNCGEYKREISSIEESRANEGGLYLVRDLDGDYLTKAEEKLE